MYRAICRRAFVCAVLFAWSVATSESADTSTAKVSVYFSPNGGCTDAITNAIASAKQSIHVQAYSFTSAPIAKSLVDAHRRGVNVKVILDSPTKRKVFICHIPQEYGCSGAD